MKIFRINQIERLIKNNLKKNLIFIIIYWSVITPFNIVAQNANCINYNKRNTNLPINYVNSMSIDKYGNKWFTTDWELILFDNKNWVSHEIIGPSVNLNMEDVKTNPIIIDNYDSLWVGGMCIGGFSKFINKNLPFHRFRRNDSLPKKYCYVTDVVSDTIGNLWVGTYTDLLDQAFGWWGITRFDGTNWTPYIISSSNELTKNVVDIDIDTKGNIWAGTEGGLAKFDGINWTVYNKENSGLPGYLVRSIVIDKNDNKWILVGGSFNYQYSQSLVKFDGINWTIYNKKNSGIAKNEIKSLAIDSNDNIWLGIKENGLVKFDGINWTIYNKNNSCLNSNYVNEIIIDDKDNLWISTTNGSGIIVFNEKGIK